MAAVTLIAPRRSKLGALGWPSTWRRRGGHLGTGTLPRAGGSEARFFAPGYTAPLTVAVLVLTFTTCVLRASGMVFVP
jgi:hypothetical protein